MIWFVSTALAQACPLGEAPTLSATMTTVTVNGETRDIRGRNGAQLVRELDACGLSEAARHFERWRGRRRGVNISALVGGAGFPLAAPAFALTLGYAVSAGARKRKMLRAVHMPTAVETGVRRTPHGITWVTQGTVNVDGQAVPWREARTHLAASPAALRVLQRGRRVEYVGLGFGVAAGISGLAAIGLGNQRACDFDAGSFSADCYRKRSDGAGMLLGVTLPLALTSLITWQVGRGARRRAVDAYNRDPHWRTPTTATVGGPR